MNKALLAAPILFCLYGCHGGQNGLGADGCTGFCQETATALSVSEVKTILAQAMSEADARGASATVAVADRAGNVLAVFRMSGADLGITIDGGRSVAGGLDGVSVIPDTLAAISKAITAAYLSSEGNAFSTRTASQIVQEHFNPGETGQPAGPLFGVQFSSLPCSDLSTRGLGPTAGPHRSPLGLAADPGGLPLYKNGTVVGGIGVIADGVYGVDLNIRDRDQDLDELIALAGSFGFEAPANRRADSITADAKTFRFSDARSADLAANPASALDFDIAINGVLGALVAVPTYAAAAVIAGTAFSRAESGVRAATDPAFAALDGFVLVDGADFERFAPIAGTDGAAIGAGNILTAAEVRQTLASALAVANRARAQIRRPLGTEARVTVSVVDTFGAVLGIVRTRDAPVFGIDVSLQKARTAVFFSNSAAAGDLLATPDTSYLASGTVSSIADYVQDFRDFLELPAGLSDGAIAFSARAIGNLARPFFPDGIPETTNGPLSKPDTDWSVFSTGLQLDLINNALVQHVTFILGGGADVAAGACTQLPLTAGGARRLPNGIQIFPGGMPIYRSTTLVGGIGISGDGVDQDDMVAFLGLHEAGQILGTINHAAAAMRADTLAPRSARLRYVQCPQAPFHGSDTQNVCENK
jgi:uncharacterized protein GlcG (DUF336 family)